MRTYDGGNSWVPHNIDGGQMPRTNFISLYDSVVYAGGDNLLYRSDDFGEVWEEQQLPPSLNDVQIYHVHLLSSEVAIGVGHSGTIIRTSNGGGTVGINENQKKKIKVFPNPAAETITLDLEKDLNVESLVMMDMQEKVVRTFEADQRLLNIHNLAFGQYIIQITTNVGRITRKVVKE